MKATSAPAAAGAMLYHSMLIQVLACPTSFHQLYSMMKLAAVVVAHPRTSNNTASTMRLRICEGRIDEQSLKPDETLGPVHDTLTSVGARQGGPYLRSIRNPGS